MEEAPKPGALQELIDALPEDQRAVAIERLSTCLAQYQKLNYRPPQSRWFNTARIVASLLAYFLVARLLFASTSSNDVFYLSEFIGQAIASFLMFVVLLFIVALTKRPIRAVFVLVPVGLILSGLAGVSKLPLNAGEMEHGFWRGFLTVTGNNCFGIACVIAIGFLFDSLYAWHQTRKAWVGGPLDMMIGDLQPLVEGRPAREASLTEPEAPRIVALIHMAKLLLVRSPAMIMPPRIRKRRLESRIAARPRKIDRLEEAFRRRCETP